MYSIEDIYSQSLKDRESIQTLKPLGFSVTNHGVKIQKFLSKTEIMNCNRNGDYYQECNEDEYELFFIHGWKKGGLRLSMMNYKRKLDMIENKIRNERNTRKNDKHIKKLKTNRENLLIKYSVRQKQLIKLNENEKKHL
tara:strand:- start:236 stop:652 length:417 start_codon:yes stop_codon:yes gene_type:complete